MSSKDDEPEKDIQNIAGKYRHLLSERLKEAVEKHGFNELGERYFLNIMVGKCPRCHSDNVHDCSSIQSDPDIGSNCPKAIELDAIDIGHCDNCDYLWCLECGAPVPKGVCGHWDICGKCEKYLRENHCKYELDMSKCHQIDQWKKSIGR